MLAAGGRLDRPGFFFQPAVLTGITPSMRLYHEEAFGPVAMLYRVPDTAAAVALANDSSYGLAATVFGNTDEAESVAGQLDVGSVGVNGFLGGPVEIPFGGTKSSGFGREAGRSRDGSVRQPKNLRRAVGDRTGERPPALCSRPLPTPQFRSFTGGR